MSFDLSTLRNDEKIMYSLRSLFSSCGYSPYKMSRFEEYDFYVKNKDFLVSDRMITFNDSSGKLMALKPDVTLSIIKSCSDDPGQVQKLYYNENVYRTSASTGEFKELMQIGIECIGDINMTDVSEVVTLAARSLKEIAADCILEISHLGILSSIVESLDISDNGKRDILVCVGKKNTDELKEICETEHINDNIIISLCNLIRLYSPINKALPDIKTALDASDLFGVPAVASSFSELEKLIYDLSSAGIADMCMIDFSVSGDLNYYNGIIFSGFVGGISKAILSGGQYDRLMRRIGRRSRAIGFAIYQDLLEDITEPYDQKERSKPQTFYVKDDFLNIALPKGRLGENVYKMFASAGFECPDITEKNRKLIFENPEKKIRYFWAKPSDVQIYVERGTADIGVAGKDILLEYQPDIYELLDLNIGKCNMCVAAPCDFKDDPRRTLKVATKFANIARSYYSSIDRDIDIIHLNGSIEIAPILGLSDVIVDIVETGKTLKENNLKVFQKIVPISARLVANKAKYKFKSAAINEICKNLGKMIYTEGETK